MRCFGYRCLFSKKIGALRDILVKYGKVRTSKSGQWKKLRKEDQEDSQEQPESNQEQLGIDQQIADLQPLPVGGREAMFNHKNTTARGIDLLDSHCRAAGVTASTVEEHMLAAFLVDPHQALLVLEIFIAQIAEDPLTVAQQLATPYGFTTTDELAFLFEPLGEIRNYLKAAADLEVKAGKERDKALQGSGSMLEMLHKRRQKGGDKIVTETPEQLLKRLDPQGYEKKTTK